MPPSPDQTLQLILGLRVKQRRTEKGLSLTETARAAGLSVSYLSEIEKGKKHPRLDKVMDLARALDLSPEDLVSLRPDRNLDPVSAALGSRFMQEFPFHLFGVEPAGLLDLADDPARAAALLRTFLDVGRMYDIQVDHFLLAALRSYQELHRNHFENLELEAKTYRSSRGWGLEAPLDAETLRGILEREYDYQIDEDVLPASDKLRRFRWVYKEGKPPRLFVNGGLLPSQRAFVYAYELGFLHLGLQTRASASSWLEVASFDQVLDNFMASYFAGALLMPEDVVTKDLQAWLGAPGWDGQALLDLIEKHRATPEMFLYRMAQVAPKRLGLEDTFFFRFNHRPGSHHFRPTRVLNLSRVPVPHGVGLDEHHCERWPAMQLLREMEAGTGGGGPVIKAQRSVFLDDGHEFLVVSIARPLVLSSVNACVSIGFLLDHAARERIAWCDDRAFPRVEVHLSCERCPLPRSQCEDRVAPPRVHDALKERADRIASLQGFLNGLD